MENDATFATRLAIEGGPGADASAIDDLATSLMEALSTVDGIRDVSRLVQSNNQNAKAVVPPIDWGQIALALTASGGVLVTIIAAIKDWMLRQPPGIKVKVRDGDDELEVSSADGEAIERLTRAFLQRRRSR